MKAKSIFCVVMGAMLTACSTEDPRYRDIRSLERPPTLAINKQVGEPRLSDDSLIVKEKPEKGLGEEVYLTDSTPKQLIVKQPFDQAWDLLGRALKQSDIPVTDHDESKGQYYIVYKSGGFFSKMMASSVLEHKEANVILTLENNDDKTAITASFIDHDSSASNADGYYEPTTENSEALLQLLYDTLHDNLKPE